MNEHIDMQQVASNGMSLGAPLSKCRTNVGVIMRMSVWRFMLAVSLLAVFRPMLAMCDLPEDDVGGLVGVVVSPVNSFYLVQTVTDWKKTQAGVETKGRVQVFDTHTGRLLWQRDAILGDPLKLYLSNDGHYVLLLESALRKESPDNEKIEGTTVLKIYRDGDLLCGFTYKALGLPSPAEMNVGDRIRVYSAGVSSSDALSSEHHSSMDAAIRSYETGLQDKAVQSAAPRFHENEIDVRLIDSEVRRVDLKSGTLLRSDDTNSQHRGHSSK